MKYARPIRPPGHRYRISESDRWFVVVHGQTFYLYADGPREARAVLPASRRRPTTSTDQRARTRCDMVTDYIDDLVAQATPEERIKYADQIAEARRLKAENDAKTAEILAYCREYRARFRRGEV